MCRWKEAPQQESLFLQWVDNLCESGPIQRKGFVPGPWEGGSLGWMSLGDEGGGVGAGRSVEGESGCFGVMQVGLGSALARQGVRWLNSAGFQTGWSCCLGYCCLQPLLSDPQTPPICLHLCLSDAPRQSRWGRSLYSGFGLAEETPSLRPVPSLAPGL